MEVALDRCLYVVSVSVSNGICCKHVMRGLARWPPVSGPAGWMVKLTTPLCGRKTTICLSKIGINGRNISDYWNTSICPPLRYLYVCLCLSTLNEVHNACKR